MVTLHEEHDLTPHDLLFRDYLTRGDDFCRIEIYRQAVGWYRKAVVLKPDNPVARQRLHDCSSKIKTEIRVILIILAAAAVITTLALVIF